MGEEAERKSEGLLNQEEWVRNPCSPMREKKGREEKRVVGIKGPTRHKKGGKKWKIRTQKKEKKEEKIMAYIAQW